MAKKKKKRILAKHPSGPMLPGHPGCPKGQIFDHSTGRCISIVAYKKKHPYSKRTA